MKSSGSKKTNQLRYAIVIEKARVNFAAYVPDLPGCVATGRNLPEVRRRIRQAIQLQVEGMREDGLSVPKPSCKTEYIGPNFD